MGKRLILNVRSQKSYDSLMNQLDKLDYVWVTDRVPSDADKWYLFGRETVIFINEHEQLTYGSTFDCIGDNVDYQVFKPKDSFEKDFKKD